MVAEKDYSVLPEQRAFKIHAPDAPSLAEGETENGVDLRSVLFTNDLMTVYTEASPGEEIPWHSHMPDMYQVLINIEGRRVWHYKDNEGEERSVEAGPGDVVLLPGGAENRVEILDDGPHKLLGVFPRLRVPRVEHLTGEAEGVYDPKDMPVGAWYDTMREEFVTTDEESFRDPNSDSET
jgi:quercetin dioxygenase-like cupin family protein